MPVPLPIPAQRRAFSLVELTIVLVVLGILAALVLPRFADATQNATEVAAQTNLAIIQRQVNKYHGMHGDYPTDVLGEWFVGGELPDNPLAEFDVPMVVEVKAFGAPTQTEPIDKLMTDAATKPWWYNPATGQVRARIKPMGTPVETLELYNRINGVTAADLNAARASAVAVAAAAAEAR